MAQIMTVGKLKCLLGEFAAATPVLVASDEEENEYRPLYFPPRLEVLPFVKSHMNSWDIKALELATPKGTVRTTVVLH